MPTKLDQFLKAEYFYFKCGVVLLLVAGYFVALYTQHQIGYNKGWQDGYVKGVEIKMYYYNKYPPKPDSVDYGVRGFTSNDTVSVYDSTDYR